MRDSLVALRTSGSLTATANATAVNLGKGNVLGPMTFLIYVPQAAGTTPTADFIIQQSDDNFSTTKEQDYAPQVTAAGVYEIKVNVRRQYIRLRSVIGGSSPDFGVVTCYATTGMTGRSFNVANS